MAQREVTADRQKCSSGQVMIICVRMEDKVCILVGTSLGDLVRDGISYLLAKYT